MANTLYTVVIFLFGVTMAFSHVTMRTIDEVDKFRKFLNNSQTGAWQKPLNPEMENLQNEWERSGKFEGDIILTEEQKNRLVDQFLGSKNAIIGAGYLWPGKTLVYEIYSSYFTTSQIAAIQAGLAVIASQSCVTVRPRHSGDIDYVRIEGKPDGCYSNVGRTGGRQVLNLQPAPVGSGCFTHGTIVHELLHALGFFHMQSSWDRDYYVSIVWSKIQSGAIANFYKYDSNQVSNFGVLYDYGSVLHYSEYGFSTDGSKTIIPLYPTSATIGQRVGPSASDMTKLRYLYSCP